MFKFSMQKNQSFKRLAHTFLSKFPNLCNIISYKYKVNESLYLIKNLNQRMEGKI